MEIPHKYADAVIWNIRTSAHIDLEVSLQSDLKNWQPTGTIDSIQNILQTKWLP